MGDDVEVRPAAATGLERCPRCRRLVQPGEHACVEAGLKVLPEQTALGTPAKQEPRPALNAAQAAKWFRERQERGSGSVDADDENGREP